MTPHFYPFGLRLPKPRHALRQARAHENAVLILDSSLAQQSAGKTPDALESVQKAIALGADGEEVSIEEFKAFYQALK